ncbi:MAG TPA: TetR/AcrR family transcriptional regulator [Pseudonocardiaceae bacterium]|nr:TetR/AcrR family transcriptional regulator [Pseudonocardiaceae bacterium]
MTGAAPRSRSLAGRDYGGRTAQARRADRRDRLLAAGLELFGTNGFRATSIDRLCSAANVSTRNFYEEFISREALLIALYDQVNTEALRAVYGALSIAEEQQLNTAARLATAITAYVHTTSDDPRWTRINYVEVVGVSPEVEAHRQRWGERLRELVMGEAERAVRRGDAQPRDFEMAATAFIGAVNELVYQWTRNGRTPEVDQICAELTRVAVAMLTSP